MNQFKKLSLAVWQCKYHVVWCPKNRFRILRDKIGESVRDIIRQLCELRRIEILEGDVQIDCIHLVLSLPPKYSASEAIGFLKGKSAIKVFDLHHELKRRYLGRHFWAKSYCVSTVGLTQEQIRKYVRHQLHKDKTMEQRIIWQK